MGTIRMNITLPEELSQKLDALVPPKKKSQFITRAVQDRIDEIQKDQLAASLKEGYSERYEESVNLAREFEAIDLEGWDEY